MHVSQREKEWQKKDIYYNRYLAIRYITAVFFFANFWWLITLSMGKSLVAVVPLLLLILSGPAIWEQKEKFHNSQNTIRKTELYYLIQTLANVAFSFCYFTPLFRQLYPFLNQNGDEYLLTILLVGILLAGFALQRAVKIAKDEDRYYLTIMRYQKKTTSH